ncbi:hypothetical protein [Lactobacillus intestinalis]|uniref:Uncharacterized protein n=1 Tax=Lactobacillus intestinalis TaxID=151781 RepID=A0A4S2BPH4_9LACO|nr:hypothetical protein [Lactobacillus intestinalis]TGY16868.1 hypothetical protein E5351_02425 [Lactobacillus intestinalis]
MSLTLGIDDDHVDQHRKLPFAPSVERTGLEQAVHEAKNQQYVDEYDSLEDFRKDLYSIY